MWKLSALLCKQHTEGMVVVVEEEGLWCSEMVLKGDGGRRVVDGADDSGKERYMASFKLLW